MAIDEPDYFFQIPVADIFSFPSSIVYVKKYKAEGTKKGIFIFIVIELMMAGQEPDAIIFKDDKPPRELSIRFRLLRGQACEVALVGHILNTDRHRVAVLVPPDQPPVGPGS